MNQPRHYPAIDGLKGLLILLIVLHNLLPQFPAAGSSRIIDAIPMTSFIVAYGGALGDSLFFMISGFLISTGYRDRIQAHNISFWGYLLKRLRKLYPMYLLSNFVALIFSVLEYGPSEINLQRILFTALLQLGGGLPAAPYNSPSWFLSTLFLCYVLYFAVSYFASQRTHYLLTLVCGILTGYNLLTANMSIPLFTTSTGLGILSFSIGCIIADIYPLVQAKIPRWLPGACLAVLTVSLYLMMRYGIEIISGNSTVAFCFLFAPGTIYLVLDSKCISRLLQSKPILFLGKISMYIFFWHYPAYDLTKYIFGLLGLTLTELYFPLYFVSLILFCAIYNYCTTRAATPPRNYV